ncbi:MAG: DUF2797 domain-containing protein [Candidatus Thorarchaeota archaeon]|nr:DUF2797 domain-containing protein [Candidatus Thorarchaeota archaeon]
MQVAEIAWKQKNAVHFDAGLTVWRKDDPEPAFLALPPKKELSWTLHGPKRCIGSITASGRLERCPENSIVLGTGQKCGPCQAGDIADPCIRCDGRRCDAIEARKLQCDATTYVIYAVLFNDGTLKVGVSSKGRALTRWVEQGADYAGVLREIEGGRTARRVEDRIGRLQGITKQVRSERKTRALLDKLDMTAAHALLEQFMESASHLELNSNVELFDLSSHYTLKDLESQPSPWRKRSEPIDGKAIVGEIVGMKGSLMVTRIDTSIMVVDLRQIIGYNIDLDSDITLVTQTGLMDFF